MREAAGRGLGSTPGQGNINTGAATEVDDPCKGMVTKERQANLECAQRLGEGVRQVAVLTRVAVATEGL